MLLMQVLSFFLPIANLLFRELVNRGMKLNQAQSKKDEGQAV